MSANFDEHEFRDVLRTIQKRPFSTKDFIDVLKVKYPRTWGAIEAEYGHGGKGSGKHFSAFARVAHTLNRWSNKREIRKLDYAPAPKGWGSPVIRLWDDEGAERRQAHAPDDLLEGGRFEVKTTRYERNLEARRRCIEIYGLECSGCGINLEKKYGERGKDFIHVHHLIPMAAIGSEYKIDPKMHLRPVCPNCHAMIHRGNEMLSIDKLRSLLRNS